MIQATISSSCLRKPGRVVFNTEIEEKLALKHGIIERLTGIKQRYYLDDHESLNSIASDACSEAILHSGIDPAAIDMLIFYTDVLPTIRNKSGLLKRTYEVSAHILATLNQSGFEIRCECINMVGSCVVFISALQIATSLIHSGIKKNVLIVGASNNSTFLDPVDKNVFMAFGDGTAATLISASEKKDIFDFHRMTDGSGYDAGYFEEHGRLIIDRKRVAEFAPMAIRKAITGLLDKTGASMKDVDLVIPHQAGYRIIKNGIDLVGIPENKVYFCLEKFGNTGAPSVQIALSSAIEQNRLNKGDIAVLVAFGIGWNYGAALFRY